MKKVDKNINRYKTLIEKIFFMRYKDGVTEFEFHREDLLTTAKKLGMKLPRNIGDIIYSTRYRAGMPDRVIKKQPLDREWIIEGSGRSKYIFRLVPVINLIPNQNLSLIKIPDSTPEIVGKYALSDEQALLAKVRYNRLIDIFLGIAAYSLQNHLRTTVMGIGQVEIDEIYVAVDRYGRQFIIPVQAKGGKDRLSAVQTKQDFACCQEKFPELICRSISAQFIAEDIIALFELVIENSDVKILEERHYQLVPSDQISIDELKRYSERS